MQDTDTDPQQEEATEDHVDELRVLRRTTSTLTATVIGPKGLTMEVQLEGVPYDGLAGLAQRAIAFEKAMLDKGLKVPQGVRTSAPLPQSASAQHAEPQQQAQQSGPVEIPGVGGAPPRCSIHGAMKWLEGTSKSTGKEFAFYACTQRDCRPAKSKA